MHFCLCKIWSAIGGPSNLERVSCHSVVCHIAQGFGRMIERKKNYNPNKPHNAETRHRKRPKECAFVKPNQSLTLTQH